jgi:uncharacterized membrane protein
MVSKDLTNILFPTCNLISFGIQWFALWKARDMIIASAQNDLSVSIAKKTIAIVVIIQILMVVLIFAFILTRDTYTEEKMNWAFLTPSIIFIVVNIIVLGANRYFSKPKFSGISSSSAKSPISDTGT